VALGVLGGLPADLGGLVAVDAEDSADAGGGALALAGAGEFRLGALRMVDGAGPDVLFAAAVAPEEEELVAGDAVGNAIGVDGFDAAGRLRGWACGCGG
jgi:hypothetical protein